MRNPDRNSFRLLTRHIVLSFAQASLFIVMTYFISCSPSGLADTSFENDTASSNPLASGIELQYVNTGVRPQDNFYRFVNGNWLEETEIPADRSRWGSFDMLREQSEDDVLSIILEAAEKSAEPGSNAQKIGDMFTSFMDTDRLEDSGLKPLENELQMINGITTHDDLVNFWGSGHFRHHRSGGPFIAYVAQDLQQADRYITYLTQSGLGLPDREYYLADDPRSRQLRDEYRNYIRSLWDAAGWSGGEEAADRVLELETQLAEIHWTRVQNRDRQATYNKMSIDDLENEAPGFQWKTFLSHAGLEAIDEIVVNQPSYLQSFAGFWDTVEPDIWKTYLRFHLLRTSASYLNRDFDQAHFDFYGRILRGQEEQRSRERRAASAVERTLGYMVGKLYVEQFYPEEAARRMDEMIKNLKIAFDESIRDLEWMTDETKQEALAKLSSFHTKIGFPEVWRDYDCLEVSPSGLLDNIRNSSRCEYERNIGRLGTEVDRDEWGMTPQTVNAYYNVVLNEIVFPAAILQPPFFNVEADDAVNYGAIGAVIGHEISHGFDDQGRRSDGDGNLRDWWTDKDEAQFQERAQMMIDQFNAYNPIDDMTINGELALGENIADLGGLNVAYRAYINSLGGEEPPVIDGFTGQQRFFMGWAQIWRIRYRDEALRQQLLTGPHSPGKYRVIGALSNIPEFYEAFDIGPGDAMYRDDMVRVKIW
jgi:putative endopeptidase